MQDDAYIKVRDVNINKGAKDFKAEVWAAKSGGSIEIYVDRIDADCLIGNLKINPTGETENWQVQSTKLRPAQGLHEGLHDLYFVFKVPDKNTVHFNWWQIKGTK
ncbi:carbohydrate-binding protein [Arachidicoccus ginsenosidivorans]|uniref:Carbohydrate-binding protein n=1 Tax=Arachidicoccus ginsenosidivorans TaxID=496057 RepID=A0A5B8VRG2_9BACT|nr:carbohydrate-binding protein [Arachidicoccus ginsenosidivorans]QEC73681.1 carbohydrate-binding protein [Arachidicoccus ginsenosidivorans]